MTEKQRAFVQEYLVDLNASQAARRAGYSARRAGRTGWELLRRPEVADAVAAALGERAERTGITQERVLEHYARLAFFDPRKLYDEHGALKGVHDLDEETATAIAALETLERAAGSGKTAGTVRKVRLADRRAALADLGKHLGLFDGKAEKNDVGRDPALTVIVHGKNDGPVT